MKTVETPAGRRAHIQRPTDEEAISAAVNEQAMDARGRLGFTLCGMAVPSGSEIRKETTIDRLARGGRPICGRCVDVYAKEGAS